MAIPLTWTLLGVTFYDGGTAHGSFVYDADLDSYSSFNITTTAGSAFGGATYGDPHRTNPGAICQLVTNGQTARPPRASGESSNRSASLDR
jgi:hypothetical protein